jgi:hypothetical protein
MPEGNQIEWLPILTQLGEKTIARIFDRSPDIQTAILEARENFQKAEEEARVLRNKGHENDEPS